MTVKGSAMIKTNQLDTAEKSLIKENEQYVAHESSWIGNASGQISEIESKTAEKSDSYTTCFDSSTNIETNKGNVNIANINTGDLILSYNHYSGKFEYKPIAAVINHGLKVYQVIEMFLMMALTLVLLVVMDYSMWMKQVCRYKSKNYKNILDISSCLIKLTNLKSSFFLGPKL